MGICSASDEVGSSVTLAPTQQKLPVVGLGTWKASDEAELVDAIGHALDAGYRHFDCAACYQNEKVVGKAFKAAFESKKVTRKDLFITSKLWNSEHAPEDVITAAQQTINDLECEYLDLYLIHW